MATPRKITFKVILRSGSSVGPEKLNLGRLRTDCPLVSKAHTHQSVTTHYVQ